MGKNAIVRKPKRQSVEIDNFLDEFRRNFGSFMYPPFSSWGSHFFPRSMLGEIRTPLCDMIDRGDRYVLHVEVPGIEKEKIELKATKNGVVISAEHLGKTNVKNRDYVYNERSHRSFYRRILTPQEIIPSKINAKMTNGILNVELPKKQHSRPDNRRVKVN